MPCTCKQMSCPECGPGIDSILPPTPSEARFAKRKLLREAAGKKSLTVRTFGGVQAGTLSILNELRKGRRGPPQRNLSMDELLYKLAALGRKYGV